MQTYDPRIYAVGECAAHRGIAYGLVAPLFEQGKVCANHLAQFGIGRYAGSVTSTKLKVTGIDLFSAGDFIGRRRHRGDRAVRSVGGVYKKLVIRDDKLVGAVLYGDTVDGSWYFQLLRDGQDDRRHPRPPDVRPVATRRHRPPGPEQRRRDGRRRWRCAAATACARARSSRRSRSKGLFTLDDVRKHTKARQSCGSCTGLVEQILAFTVGGDYQAADQEEADVRLHRPHPRGGARRDPRAAAAVDPGVMQVLEWRTPNGCATLPPGAQLLPDLDLAARGRGRSAVALHQRARHANIQKDGTYSVVPRMWGGVTTADELRRIADVVDKYKIPTVKVTGGQRIDLLGVKKEDLPGVWRDLGMPSATPTPRRCAP